MSATPWTIGHVTSADGTRIGYRQLGRGPGLVLVHGALQASQSFSALGRALSDAFTISVIDRRGRGESGPHRPDHCLAREREDVDALLEHTGAERLFGLSSGAIVSLETARLRPSVRKLALYEPPLSTDGSSPTEWVDRLREDVAAGDLGGGMITVLKGTRASRAFGLLPRFLLAPVLRRALESDAQSRPAGAVALKTLVPTAIYDGQIVRETENTLPRYAELGAEVLLVGGSRSPAYLHQTLDRLQQTLPRARKVMLDGADHIAASDQGQPARVAQVLREFFAG